MMRDRSLAATAAIAAALAAPPAFAQQIEAEIIVTAPLEGAQIESLQGATILRRDEIVATLNGGLGDTLDSQLGVSSTSFGAGASRPIIRGLGEDRVRVLQNGIGAIDASTASPDHAVTSDGLDAERIEILRGAAALAYGGNAIGGVVNVIDQSIPTRVIDSIEAQGLAAYSTVDEGAQGAVNIGAGAGPFALRLSASARETDPYDTPLGEALNQWTDLQSYVAGASLVREQGFLGLAVRQTENSYGLLPEDPSEPGGHIDMEQTRIEARGDMRIDVGLFDRLDFAAQHSDYEHIEFEGDGAPGTIFTSEGYEARAEAHHGGERLDGAIGLQFVNVDFEATGEHPFIAATNTQDIGVFAVERWDAGGWGLEGGLRFERRDVSSDTLSRDFDNVSGSLGVFVRPAQNWFLGATAAHTERAPTAIELFAEGPHHATETYERGDPNLGQERALSFEASARFDNDGTRFEFNLFHVAFDDYIALVGTDLIWYEDEFAVPEDGVLDPINVPADAIFLAGLSGDAEILPVFDFVQQAATFTGAEVFVGADLFEAGGVTFSGDAAFDVVRAEFDAGGHPPRIPARTLTIGLDAEGPHWSGRVEMVDIGEQNRLGPFETSTGGYTLLNAGLAFRPYGGDRLVLRIDGRNLTDELARAHTSFLKDDLPLPGRNLRFTVLANF